MTIIKCVKLYPRKGFDGVDLWAGSVQEKGIGHGQDSLIVSSSGSGWPPLSSCVSS